MQQLRSYRVYRVNKRGRLVAGDWVEAEDDVAARRVALDFCGPSTPAVEIWEGTRFVGTVSCDPSDGTAGPP